MPINGFSYDYQNQVRDLNETFKTLIAKAPFLLSLIKIGGEATNTKHEWLEDTLSPTSTAITSFTTDGDGTGINVASTAGLRAGAILRVVSSTGATKADLLKIASVDSATKITVVRAYGGSTAATLTTSDVLHLVSSPLGEKTTGTAQASSEPSLMYNFMQIFERTADVSKTALAVKKYGIGDALDWAVKQKLQEIAWEMNASLIFNRRVQRTASENGSFGGILQFLEGGNVETSGGALSKTHLNNLLHLMFGKGAYSSNYAIVCAENQAARISAFNTAGSNPLVTMPYAQNQATGGAISTFYGDLPVQNSFAAKIVVEPNFPKDKVAILDLDKISLVPLAGRSLSDSDATPAGFDGAARRIIGEYTLEVQNGTQAHGIATGLTI